MFPIFNVKIMLDRIRVYKTTQAPSMFAVS
jgi:hypothetical protein